jgi:hypothetical protein
MSRSSGIWICCKKQVCGRQRWRVVTLPFLCLAGMLLEMAILASGTVLWR